MTTENVLGIPIIEAKDTLEPLASVLRLLRQTHWHPSEDEMNQWTAQSVIGELRYLLKEDDDNKAD